ncbi:MAG: hypothetical protein D3909_02190 [Candidatus Electrothrix sp. ATG1]|nr:hypothetical protein [Candidatus Electrothrix sp. ATG1]
MRCWVQQGFFRACVASSRLRASALFGDAGPIKNNKAFTEFLQSLMIMEPLQSCMAIINYTLGSFELGDIL